MFFFFSSRRRHTRCALVTGVQTCALPILVDGPKRPIPVRLLYPSTEAADTGSGGMGSGGTGERLDAPLPVIVYLHGGGWVVGSLRSEERRGGKGCVSKCRSRWSRKQ